MLWRKFNCVCPASPDEEDQGTAGLLLRTYSAGPVSPICLMYKAESWQLAATLDDSTRLHNEELVN